MSKSKYFAAGALGLGSLGYFLSTNSGARWLNNSFKKKEVNKAEAVPFVNPEYYLGKWYQVYRTANSFQNDKAIQTTAEYSLKDPDILLKDGGEITVVNTETFTDSNGKQEIKIAKGSAISRSGETYNKLLVSFFKPFWGDYWILDLGDQIDGLYSHALVGSPFSNSMWVLSRTETLDPQVFASILKKAQDFGFTLDRPVV